MDEILPHLHLGDMHDAVEAIPYMAVLCVMWDNEPNIPKGVEHIQTTDYLGMDEPFTLVENMDKAADWIDRRVQDGFNVLVHCAYGVERSPLTVVWYLMRHRGMDLCEAYQLVMDKHPQAQYRGGWLPQEVRLSGHL